MNATPFAAAITLVLALGGCADAPATQTANGPAVATADAAPPKLICHKERPIGSDISQTVCRRADDEAADARGVDAAKRQVSQDGGVAAQQAAHARGY